MATGRSISPGARGYLRFAVRMTTCVAIAGHPLASFSAENAPETVRGIVRAVDVAMISTDLQARVSHLGFREGEHFHKGDVIVEFDCRKQRAELASAEAQQHEMTLNLDNFRMLQKVQAAGKHDLEISEVRVIKASAEADILRARIDECSVLAPFDGSILEQSIHEHEAPTPGKPFVGLIGDGDLEIDLIVPSKWMPWLRPGAAFSFLVEETQGMEPVEVRRIGAAVDPISQTIKIVAAFKSAAKGVRPGMSGTGRFERVGG